jgi:hypothetical protein
MNKKIEIASSIFTVIAIIGGVYGYNAYINNQKEKAEFEARAAAKAKADAIPRWQYAALSADKSMEFSVRLPVKTDSKDQNLKYTWIKVGTNKGEEYQKYSAFNCDSRSYISYYLKVYDKAGKVTTEGDLNDKWTIVSPDSIAETELKIACGEEQS